MKYSENYYPPAPIGYVTLRNQITMDFIKNVPMILDTGSDITLLSKKYCEKIGIEISEDYLTLEGFDKAKSIAFYVTLDFIFLNKMFRGKFLVFDQDEGIIGRDILNEFSILFDGKNLSWKEI